MSIEVKHVTKRFGQTLALDDVSLRFEENKIYGLLGNNGAGKSTLLNVITNRLYADAGEVTIDGMPAADNDAALSRLFLMGDQNLYPDDMRVRGAFRVAAAFYPGFDMAYADSVAQRFGLNTKKKITALSTGYASIFRLVVALSVNAPYLFLDEPVLGLDAQHRDMFYKLLIEKYSENPCTMVISTHLIQEVAGIIEHTVILRDGRVIRDLPLEELMRDVCAVSGPAGLVDQYIAGREVISVQNLGGLKTACIQGRPDDKALPAGLEVGSVNLQDYFIRLMGEEERQ